MSLSVSELFAQASVEILAVKTAFVFDPLADVDSLIYAPARKALFFDETVPLYVVLRIPATADSLSAMDLASRVSLSVEASISDGATRTNAPAPLVRQDSYSRRMNAEQGQIVYTKNLENSVTPVICQSQDQQIAVWCHDTVIPYTRTRGVVSKVSFGVTLTLNDATSVHTSTDDGDKYMEEVTPAARDKNYNLLRALESDLYLSKDPPRITASRVSAMAPLVDSSTKRPKKSAKRFFPISPAIALRIRSFNVPFSNHVILSIDMEPKQGISNSIMLESIDIQAPSAEARAISDNVYPLRMGVTDSFTFSFDLDPGNKQVETRIPLSLVVSLRPILYEGDNPVGPLVTSRWNTTISLTTNNVSGSLRRTPSQTTARGTLQKAASHQIVRSASAMSSTSVDVHTSRGGTSINTLAGILAEVRVPAACQVGHTLAVELSITNGSQTTKNLAIEVSRATRRKVLPQIPNTNGRAILTDSEIKELHAHHAQDSYVEMICLTTSLVMDPLQSDARKDITLKYLPMAAGTTTLHEFRIVDTTNGLYQDFKNLPTIVIYKQQG